MAEIHFSPNPSVEEVNFVKAFRELIASYAENGMSIASAADKAQEYVNSPLAKIEVIRLANGELEHEPQPSKQVCAALDGKGQIPLVTFFDYPTQLNEKTAVVYRGGREPFVIAHNYDWKSGTWSHGDYNYTNDLIGAVVAADPDLITDACYRYTVNDLCEALEAKGYKANAFNVGSVIEDCRATGLDSLAYMLVENARTEGIKLMENVIDEVAVALRLEKIEPELDVDKSEVEIDAELEEAIADALDGGRYRDASSSLEHAHAAVANKAEREGTGGRGAVSRDDNEL